MCKIVTVFILIYVISIAIFLGKVQDVITVSVPNQNLKVLKNKAKLDESTFISRNSRMEVMGDAYAHLLLFLQISDIHLSMFQDPGRISAFRKFCNVTVNTVQPAVVIASGDLTDGKYEDGLRTHEFEQEWIEYNHALLDNGVLNKTLWLDMRGNHDNFNVHKNAPSLYDKYAVQAQRLNGSYFITVVPYNQRKSSKPSEKYSFIGVDAALIPGPKAPWNFYGKINEEEFHRLAEFEKMSRESNGSIWFGHYPTSFIAHPKGLNIRDLMSNAGAYLCGHLHTAYGLVKHMYTIQPNGLLELELADFKINRRFRVAAFDHGILAFRDVDHDVWPVILITNPKNVLFNNPMDLDVSKKSTHIRILVFSPGKMKAVKVKVDNDNWSQCQQVGDTALYVLKWRPHKYFEGLHEIKVSARDADGRTATATLSFAFDNSSMSFNFLGRLALMMNAETLPYRLYLGASILTVFPLVGLRLLHILVKSHCMSLRSITSHLGDCCTTVLRIFWVTATINKLYIPLVLSPLYWPLGPWSIDDLLDGSKGVAFAWGTLVEETFLPAAFSYVFDGCVQLFWFQIPFMCVLAICVEKRFRMLCWKEDLSPFWNNIPLLILVVSQVIVASTFAVYTSQYILFLGYLQKYCIVYGAILWFFSAKLKRIHFSDAEYVWHADYHSRRFVPIETVVRNGRDE